MQAIYLGLVAVFIYSFYVGVKNLIKLYKAGASGRKKFWGFLIFFVFAPCIFTSGYYIIDKEAPSIWLIAPLLLLAFMWFILGYFIQAAYQALGNAKKTTRQTKEVTNKRLLIGGITFLVGFAIWLGGLIFGYPHWESSLVVVSMFLIIVGVKVVFSNLEYLGDKPKK